VSKLVYDELEMNTNYGTWYNMITHKGQQTMPPLASKISLVLIDNYDSFTFNLVHYFEELDAKISVYQNDKINIDQIQALKPDAIIISPGPGSPKDSGISLEAIKNFAGIIPILGVCLGHQSIAEVFGGEIIRAPYPMHGKIDNINHNNSSVFKDLPQSFKITRYHSLMIDPLSLPDDIEITATTNDNIIMAIRHKKYNIHGVQFHPESITTEHGHKMLQNFMDMI
jgi:anthranilate synthase component II